MTIKVCVAGATGWVGQVLVKEILGSNQFTLAEQSPEALRDRISERIWAFSLLE
jgi:dihydrodipicolinate reductase